jgi:hypothetical protein
MSSETELAKKYLLARRRITANGCWEYIGARRSAGYGSLIYKFNGKKIYSPHRLSFLAFNGPLKRGLQVCHHCDNPPCFNPEHLFAGTQQDNIDDMVRKRNARFDKMMKDNLANFLQRQKDESLPHTRQAA